MGGEDIIYYKILLSMAAFLELSGASATNASRLHVLRLRLIGNWAFIILELHK